MTDKEVMQMALDVLIDIEMSYECGKEIEALRAALAQPEPAPVAWADRFDIEREGHDFWVSRQKPAKNGVPLYTAPKREWVGLTDEEIEEGQKQSWVDRQAFESAVWWAEEKLKGKNNG